MDLNSPLNVDIKTDSFRSQILAFLGKNSAT